MESAVGPSDKWPYNEEIAKRENLIAASWNVNTDIMPPHRITILHIIRKWMEWAYSNGDPTLWEFANKDSFPGTVHYHNSDHKHEDFQQWIPDVCGEWLAKEGMNDEQPDNNGPDNAETPLGSTGGDISPGESAKGDPGNGGNDDPLIQVI